MSRERPDARLLLGLAVGRILARPVDQELLGLARVHPVLEQPRGVRIGRILEHHARAGGERRPLLRIDDLDGASFLLVADDEVAGAVDHHRALAELDLLRRVGRRLQLHHALLGELLEILPAEVARDLEGRVHDGARVGGMALDHLARPFRVEQVLEALRYVLFLHQLRVVGDRRDQDARHDAHPVRIVVGLVVMLGDLLRQVGREPAAPLPDDAVRRIRGVGEVDVVNLGAVFLADALEHALGAGALHLRRDAGILRLERLAEPLRRSRGPSPCRTTPGPPSWRRRSAHR